MTTGSVSLTVTGATGYVTGWFDWNQDGDFADSGEQAFANEPVADGQTVVKSVCGRHVGLRQDHQRPLPRVPHGADRCAAVARPMLRRSRPAAPAAARWRATPGPSARWR